MQKRRSSCTRLRYLQTPVLKIQKERPQCEKIHCKRTFRLVFRIKNLEIFNRTSLKVPLELQFIENTTCFIFLSNTCFFPPLSVCSTHYSTGHRKNQPQTTTFSNKYRKNLNDFPIELFLVILENLTLKYSVLYL